MSRIQSTDREVQPPAERGGGPSGDVPRAPRRGWRPDSRRRAACSVRDGVQGCDPHEGAGGRAPAAERHGRPCDRPRGHVVRARHAGPDGPGQRGRPGAAAGSLAALGGRHASSAGHPRGHDGGLPASRGRVGGGLPCGSGGAAVPEGAASSARSDGGWPELRRAGGVDRVRQADPRGDAAAGGDGLVQPHGQRRAATSSRPSWLRASTRRFSSSGRWPATRW